MPLNNLLKQIYVRREEILRKSIDYFRQNIGFIPKFGFELEFYLFKDQNLLKCSKQEIDNFLIKFNSYLDSNFSLVKIAKKEQGGGQIEIETDYTDNILLLAKELELAKIYAFNLAVSSDLIADFSAQPSDKDCGNSLQINISLHDEAGNSVLSDLNILDQLINNLLSSSNQILAILAPNLEDYLRFNPKTNHNLFKLGKYSAPVNLSYGNDNRSCAIRLVNKHKVFSRLEYRVPCANADIFLSSSAVILAMIYNRNLEYKFEKIYGNAFDYQYKLIKLHQDQETSHNDFFREGNFIKEKIVEFL